MKVGRQRVCTALAASLRCPALPPRRAFACWPGVGRGASVTRGTPRRPSLLQVAVEGCCHGELDQIYACLAQIEEAQSIKVQAASPR